jgi:hypothetical protein
MRRLQHCQAVARVAPVLLQRYRRRAQPPRFLARLVKFPMRFGQQTLLGVETALHRAHLLGCGLHVVCTACT